MSTILDNEHVIDRAGHDQAGNTLLLHVERVDITKRSVVTGTVGVSLQTVERSEPVSIELATDSVDVKRVAIGRVVDAAPEIRLEGDITIVPVMEEILVVEKRLMLKEELHIRRIRTTHTETQTVILREQRAVIDRSNDQALPPTTSTHPSEQDR